MEFRASGISLSGSDTLRTINDEGGDDYKHDDDHDDEGHDHDHQPSHQTQCMMADDGSMAEGTEYSCTVGAAK